MSTGYYNNAFNNYNAYSLTNRLSNSSINLHTIASNEAEVTELTFTVSSVTMDVGFKTAENSYSNILLMEFVGQAWNNLADIIVDGSQT